jgi:hypothetical protein
MEQTNLTFVKYKSGSMVYGPGFEGALLIAGCPNCVKASQFARDYLETKYREEFPDPELNLSSCDLGIKALIDSENLPKVLVDSRDLGKKSMLERI